MGAAPACPRGSEVAGAAAPAAPVAPTPMLLMPAKKRVKFGMYLGNCSFYLRLFVFVIKKKQFDL